ncbi:unnamed protein product [Phytomonas sp. Hart1]|nr:unnamed protein product [Phytomonas sp. Hart1]|eukprot:CCW69532.1 unnamed protein product [Phytomonas sp. isolate Hart1]
MISPVLDASSSTVPKLPASMDVGYYAISLLRRRKLNECVAFASNQRITDSDWDSAASGDKKHLNELLWYAQTKAMVLQHWFDDASIEDDGVNDVLLEGEQTVVSSAQLHEGSMEPTRQQTSRKIKMGVCGTSREGGLGTTGGGHQVGSRHGFARTGSLNNRPGTLQGGCGGTAARPTTGRFTRVSTASLQLSPGSAHIQTQFLNFEDFAHRKPMLAKVLCDYLLYVEHQPKFALGLCTAMLRPSPPPAASVKGPSGLPLGMSSVSGDSSILTKERVIPRANDWWWKARLGKANYQLGLLREAEKCFKDSLCEPSSGSAFTGGTGSSTLYGKNSITHFENYNTSTIMELGKVYKKMNQPLSSLELFTNALMENCIDYEILLCCARLRNELHHEDEAYNLFQQVLGIDSSNVEAIAQIAAYIFYEKKHPDMSLNLYNRLLQMGVNTVEVWNNIGVSSLCATQLDHAFKCFERAMQCCPNDAQRADVWYNIGHVYIGIGDLRFAERAFRLAVATDSSHAEALNNLAVLAYEGEWRKNKAGFATNQQGNHLFESALRAAPRLVEALYNSALIAYNMGEMERAYMMVTGALEEFPDHSESVALHSKLHNLFVTL